MESSFQSSIFNLPSVNLSKKTVFWSLISKKIAPFHEVSVILKLSSLKNGLFFLEASGYGSSLLGSVVSCSLTVWPSES